MDWSQIFTVDVMTYAALGAVAGAFLVLALHIGRDWEYLAHQWRYRRRIERGHDVYFEELRELEGYRPNPVTKRERQRLPQDVFMGAVIGASLVGSLQFDDPNALFYAAAVILIISLVMVLLESEVEEVGAEPEEFADPEDIPPTKWQRVKDLCIQLAVLVFFAFGFEWIVQRGSQLGITFGMVFTTAYAVAMLALMWIGISRLREGPPVDADDYELGEWNLATRMYIGAMPAAAVIFGVLSLAF